MFVCVALIYLVFGIIGKISAVFITIPHPVLGGVLIIMFGAFNGVVLSNLKSVDLSSTRNLTIIGTALLLGLVVPHWIENYPNSIKTGKIKVFYILTSMFYYLECCDIKQKKQMPLVYCLYILNAISYAPHILLMTAKVNESQFPKFSFQFIWHWSHNNTFKRKLFCCIPVFYNSLGPEKGV